MASFTPPSIGQPNSTEDPRIRDALVVLDNLLNSSDQVPTAGIADDAVTAAKIAADAVGASETGSLPACRVYHNTFQDIPAVVGYTTLAFNAEHFDASNLHDTSTNNSRLTVAQAGVYAIGGTAHFELKGSPGETGRRKLSVRVNGTTRIAVQEEQLPTAADIEVSVATIWKLAASDYVELQAYNNSPTSAQRIAAFDHYSPAFWIHFLGKG
jgi:hypothetical protein